MRRGNINMSISSFVYAYNLNVFNNATFAKLLPKNVGSLAKVALLKTFKL